MLDWILNNKGDVEIQNKTARYNLAGLSLRIYILNLVNKYVK